jgi:hypothetical protein
MPSRLTPVQVRYSDPRINDYLNILSQANPAVSKSKLLEELSREPIINAFKNWVRARREAGATYSELFADTGIPVPELMEMAEDGSTMDAAEVAHHLKIVGDRTGVDLQAVWAETPAFKLGPI